MSNDDQHEPGMQAIWKVAERLASDANPDATAAGSLARLFLLMREEITDKNRMLNEMLKLCQQTVTCYAKMPAEPPHLKTYMAARELQDLVSEELRPKTEMARCCDAATVVALRQENEELRERLSQLQLHLEPRGALADGGIERALGIADIALRFGNVTRATMDHQGRFESDTTHSFMLGLLAIELLPEGYNLAKTLAFTQVHDLVEVFADDTVTARSLSEEERAAKHRREQQALERLRSLGCLPRVVALIEAYERQECPESRWVRYIDKVCPRLTHLINGGMALRNLNMDRTEMMFRHGQKGEELARQYPEQDEARALFEAASQRCADELLTQD